MTTTARRARRLLASLTVGALLTTTACVAIPPTTPVHTDPPPRSVLGTYPVPGGVLTVYGDTSARFVPDGTALIVTCNRDAGPCREGEVTGIDRDGRVMVARDLNGDGVISGDVEYGS